MNQLNVGLDRDAVTAAAPGPASDATPPAGD